MKKSEKTSGQIKRNILDLCPDTTSMLSAKIIILVLQVFRKLTDFNGYYGSIKKPLLEIVDKIVDNKTFLNFDALDLEKIISNRALTDTEGIQSDLETALALKLHDILSLDNSQHRDYKAVVLGIGPDTAVQSIARSVNALPSRKNTSNLKKDLIYVTTFEAREKALDVVGKYLDGKVSKANAKKVFSEIVK